MQLHVMTNVAFDYDVTTKLVNRKRRAVEGELGVEVMRIERLNVQWLGVLAKVKSNLKCCVAALPPC